MTPPSIKPSGRLCLFCGRQGDLTKEHLLPQWLWRDYGDPEQDVSGIEEGPFGYQEDRDRGRGYDSMVPRFDRPSIHPAARTVRLVCAECNNGWMSRLELDFRSILRELIARRHWRLSPSDIRIARRWFQKTALMLERYDSKALMSPSAAYSAVFRDEEPPGTWYVGLGQQLRPTTAWAGTTPLVQRLAPIEEDEAEETESTVDGAITAALDRPIVYGIQHLLQIHELLFVVRYSAFEVREPARLDHELHCHPSGPFVPLEVRSAHKKWNRNKVAWLAPLSVEDLLYQWGHPTPSGVHFTLLGEGSDRWVGPSEGASAEQLLAPFGITPDEQTLEAGVTFDDGGMHLWGS